MTPRRHLRPSRRPALGVTLIELMVTIAVLAIFVSIAVPSFIEFRERAVVRGAAEQMLAVVADARMESVKRDAAVRVALARGSSDTSFCIGATVGTTDCDCFEKNPASANYCGVALYPPLDNSVSASGQSQAATAIRGAHMLADPATLFDTDAGFTFDPKLGTLASLTDGGSVTLQSPTSGMNYRVQLTVNGLGRVSACVPAGARALIGYKSC